MIWKVDMDSSIDGSDSSTHRDSKEDTTTISSSGSGSGSRDRVHVAQIRPSKRLQGHSSNIRALTWSHELPQLLLSGSWDSSIRLWDSLTGACLRVVTGDTRRLLLMLMLLLML